MLMIILRNVPGQPSAAQNEAGRRCQTQHQHQAFDNKYLDLFQAFQCRSGAPKKKYAHMTCTYAQEDSCTAVGTLVISSDFPVCIERTELQLA